MEQDALATTHYLPPCLRLCLFVLPQDDNDGTAEDGGEKAGALLSRGAAEGLHHPHAHRC